MLKCDENRNKSSAKGILPSIVQWYSEKCDAIYARNIDAAVQRLGRIERMIKGSSLFDSRTSYNWTLEGGKVWVGQCRIERGCSKVLGSRTCSEIGVNTRG